MIFICYIIVIYTFTCAITSVVVHSSFAIENQLHNKALLRLNSLDAVLNIGPGHSLSKLQQPLNEYLAIDNV